jgi:hypothetical protein
VRDAAIVATAAPAIGDTDDEARRNEFMSLIACTAAT